jgi:hypothetical protein
MEKFDELLLHVVDKTIKYSFGNINAIIIFDYLAKRGCLRNEIPRKTDVFSMELRNLLGVDMHQILGAAPILEKAILKAFCIQLQVEFDEAGPASFTDYVKKLRRIYNNERNDNTQPVFNNDILEKELLSTQLPLQENGGEK